MFLPNKRWHRMTKKKKYALMENVLIHIHATTVALEEKEKKRNNIILGEVTDTLIQIMKRKDQLFEGLFSQQYYGGSFYDNLKVGRPDEFDLDLILNIPDVIEPSVNCTAHPGFVEIRITELSKLWNRPIRERERFENMAKLLDSVQILSTDKVLEWFEGLITKTLNELPKESAKAYIDVAVSKSQPTDIIRLFITMKKGAPAFTLIISGKDNADIDIKLDIDLVPCFKFNEKKWPNLSGGYKANLSQAKSTFLVVPKKPKEANLKQLENNDRYWRLSFQEQERELIGGNDKQFLKPALKLLKKLRDKDNHKIASYFIKTIFMWSVEKEPASLWSQSLSVVFMFMLKRYESFLRSKTIPYFWNEQYNLIAYLKDSTILPIANRLKNIIDDVERNLNGNIDPYVIGKYLLPKDEFDRLHLEVPKSKKLTKQLQNAFANNALQSTTTLTDTPDSVPLEQFGYDSGLTRLYKQCSDDLDKVVNDKAQDILSQINRVGTRQETGQHDILNYMKQIDTKMNLISQKFEKMNEALLGMNEKIIRLEEKFELMELKLAVTDMRNSCSSQ